MWEVSEVRGATGSPRPQCIASSFEFVNTMTGVSIALPLASEVRSQKSEVKSQK
ncbi:MAG: hypothetical protein F6K55_08485 [Moorea sp. SIO4A3]|nr:hypothetical protein [Moorena sp. SIO4A3]